MGIFFSLQEKAIVPQPQAASNGSTGLPKSNMNNTVDTVDSTNSHRNRAGDQPDDYEKEERRRAAQRVLGKQG